MGRNRSWSWSNDDGGGGDEGNGSYGSYNKSYGTSYDKYTDYSSYDKHKHHDSSYDKSYGSSYQKSYGSSYDKSYDKSYGSSYGSSHKRDRSRGMPEEDWKAQKERNATAAAEGRAVYVRGIPFEWDASKLKEFFSHQGEVECVNLLPPKERQNARAAFVNFMTTTEAVEAAKACDNLQVENAVGEAFHLSCSLKRAPGQKVDIVSGFSELSQARQERRCVYISGLPMGYGEDRVNLLVEPFGMVANINCLPSTRNLSVFVIMATAEEAERVIENLDGQVVEGEKQLCVTYPRPPKRTRTTDDDETTLVEVRGVPNTTTAADLTSMIECSGKEVYTVKMLRHNSLKDNAIAMVYMTSKDDAAELVKELDTFEYAKGYKLSAVIKPDGPSAESSPALPEQDSVAAYVARTLASVRAASAQQRASSTPAIGGAGQAAVRAKGPAVGRLLYQASDYAAGVPDVPGPPPYLHQPPATASSAWPRPRPRPPVAPSTGPIKPLPRAPSMSAALQPAPGNMARGRSLSRPIRPVVPTSSSTARPTAAPHLGIPPKPKAVWGGGPPRLAQTQGEVAAPSKEEAHEEPQEELPELLNFEEDEAVKEEEEAVEEAGEEEWWEAAGEEQQEPQGWQQKRPLPPWAARKQGGGRARFSPY